MVMMVPTQPVAMPMAMPMAMPVAMIVPVRVRFRRRPLAVCRTIRVT
jgi:hypothetical protein